MQLDIPKHPRHPYTTSVPAEMAARSWSWPIQAVTGALLVIIVFLHMYFNHFQEGGMLDAAGVILHVSNPAIFILEVLFVFVVTYHALLGIRAVIFDLSSSERLRQKVTVGLTILGVVTVVYGIVLAWLIRSQLLS